MRGAPVDTITCWSELQKEELVQGSDWDPARVHIGGIPSYDGYFRQEWQMPRAEYFRLHGLDPQRKLLSYAASFVSFAPNYRNIEALAKLVASETLSEPCQLLIRLHPNHFWDNPLYAGEREQIQKLATVYPHVHVVEPIPLGGSLGYYGGEDMDESNYHEYQYIWALPVRGFGAENWSTNLFSILVLFLLPTHLWDYLCLAMMVSGGHLIQSCTEKISLPRFRIPKSAQTVCELLLCS